MDSVSFRNKIIRYRISLRHSSGERVLIQYSHNFNILNNPADADHTLGVSGKDNVPIRAHCANVNRTLCAKLIKMGGGKFGFQLKKDKVNMKTPKTEFSVKEKCKKIQKKLKKTENNKTENKKTEKIKREKVIWWNQCNSCKLKLMF